MKMLSNTIILCSLLFPALALSVPTKRQVCSFDAPGAGTFNHHDTFSFEGDSLPTGLYPNQDTVGGTPFSRNYDQALISVSGGYLNLKVPGGQNQSPIQGASVDTVTNDILYASVRTKASFSSIPGTVQSMPSPFSPFRKHSLPNQEGPSTVPIKQSPHHLSQRQTPLNLHRLLLLQIRHLRNRPRIPLRPHLPLEPHRHPRPPLHQPRQHQQHHS
jgi:hypothetical protein